MTRDGIMSGVRFPRAQTRRRASRPGGAAGLAVALLAAVLATGFAPSQAGAGTALQQSSPPWPVRLLSLDEVTPTTPWGNRPAYAHRPFERLRPGEWRVVGPPFGDYQKGVMGRSIDGEAVLIVGWEPHTALSDGTLMFDLRVRDPAVQPRLPANGVGDARAFVDGKGPWKLFTWAPAAPAFISTSGASVNWIGLPNGLVAVEPDDCNPGVKGCVRRPLECARHTLTLQSDGFGPFTFDLRADPLKEVFRYRRDRACGAAGVGRKRRHGHR